MIDLRERGFDKPEKASRLFARWFVFGQTATFADLSDGEGDVLCGVPLYLVDRILAAREAFIDTLEEMLFDAPYVEGATADESRVAAEENA